MNEQSQIIAETLAELEKRISELEKRVDSLEIQVSNEMNGKEEFLVWLKP